MKNNSEEENKNTNTQSEAEKKTNQEAKKAEENKGQEEEKKPGFFAGVRQGLEKAGKAIGKGLTIGGGALAGALIMGAAFGPLGLLAGLLIGGMLAKQAVERDSNSQQPNSESPMQQWRREMEGIKKEIQQLRDQNKSLSEALETAQKAVAAKTSPTQQQQEKGKEKEQQKEPQQQQQEKEKQQPAAATPPTVGQNPPTTAKGQAVPPPPPPLPPSLTTPTPGQQPEQPQQLPALSSEQAALNKKTQANDLAQEFKKLQQASGKEQLSPSEIKNANKEILKNNPNLTQGLSTASTISNVSSKDVIPPRTGGVGSSPNAAGRAN